MTTQGERIEQVKQAVKDQYAWPGGYPLYLVMSDGAALCVQCAKKELGQIVTAMVQRERNGWAAEGAEINWEDSDLYCAHCNKPVESAYGGN